jgi:addiction module HigA family antidote
MDREKLPPIHPGEILLEEFLEPMGISQYRLAKDISVPPPDGSTRSYTASVQLRQTQHYGCRGTLAYPNGFG